MSKRFKNLSFNTTCTFIQHCRKPSDVTLSRDKTHKATHLTRLSYIKKGGGFIVFKNIGHSLSLFLVPNRHFWGPGPWTTGYQS